jgi:hypothetical protein
LSNLELITVKVYHPGSIKSKKDKEEGNHWVMVYAKNGEDYLVRDPAGFFSTLSQSGLDGKVYRFIRVFKA